MAKNIIGSGAKAYKAGRGAPPTPHNMGWLQTNLTRPQPVNPYAQESQQLPPPPILGGGNIPTSAPGGAPPIWQPGGLQQGPPSDFMGVAPQQAPPPMAAPSQPPPLAAAPQPSPMMPPPGMNDINLNRTPAGVYDPLRIRRSPTPRYEEDGSTFMGAFASPGGFVAPHTGNFNVHLGRGEVAKFGGDPRFNSDPGLMSQPPPEGWEPGQFTRGEGSWLPGSWEELQQMLLGDEESETDQGGVLGGLAGAYKQGRGGSNMAPHDMNWLQTNLARPQLQDAYGIFGVRR